MTTQEIVDDIRTNHRDIIDFESLERRAKKDFCGVYEALVDRIRDNYNCCKVQATEVADVFYEY